MKESFPVSGKGRLLIITATVVALFSAFGLYRLFALRFEAGDMFPPCSSLRTDPLGCKALFMALERMPEMEVARNFRDLDRLQGASGRTIFYLGAKEELLTAAADRQAGELETLAGNGNRVVVALVPATGGAAAQAATDKPAAGDDEAEADGEETTGEPRKECGCKPGRFGVGAGFFAPTGQPDAERPTASLATAAPGLPGAIPLHSRRWLQPQDDGWQPVYTFRDKAVVLERRVGKGSIVLMADSYLLSNEALRNDRQPGLLAWLQGTHRSALFDESHLGVRDNPGVMTLIRKHRLVPFLVALMALAILYVWKIAVPFATPPVPEEERREALRDNFSGLAHLLRRNIAPADLLDTCFREWSRSFSRELRQRPAIEEQVRAIVAEESAHPRGKRDPLARYREIEGRLKAEGRRLKGEG